MKYPRFARTLEQRLQWAEMVAAMRDWQLRGLLKGCRVR